MVFWLYMFACISIKKIYWALLAAWTSFSRIKFERKIGRWSTFTFKPGTTFRFFLQITVMADFCKTCTSDQSMTRNSSVTVAFTLKKLISVRDVRLNSTVKISCFDSWWYSLIIKSQNDVFDMKHLFHLTYSYSQ